MIAFLHHLFIPHHGNNHRSKILHNSSIFIIVAALFLLSISTRLLHNAHPEILGISYSISTSDLLDLVNLERKKNNLPTLSMNENLAQAARGKANDMFYKNYWAHFGPDGTSPWDFIKDSGYQYLYAGENLAKGFTDSKSIIDAWMNSDSHRANILSPKYREIGFAIEEGKLLGEETVLIVELFGATEGPLIAANQEVSEISSSVPSRDQQILNQYSQVAQIKYPQNLLGGSGESKRKPAIDMRFSAKTVSIFILSVIFFTLVIDLIIIERKKIPRLVGHNLDHIMLIAIFIIFIIIEKTGRIL